MRSSEELVDRAEDADKQVRVVNRGAYDDGAPADDVEANVDADGGEHRSALAEWRAKSKR